MTPTGLRAALASSALFLASPFISGCTATGRGGVTPAAATLPTPAAPAVPTLPLVSLIDGEATVGSATFGSTPVELGLVAKSASFATISLDGGQFLVVKITDQADDCGLVGSSSRRQGSSSLIFALYRLDASGQTTAPEAGDYRLDSNNVISEGAGGFGTAEVAKLDATCEPSREGPGQSGVTGELHLTEVGSQKLVGSFDLRLAGTPEPLQGRFTAVACPALAAATAHASAHICL